MRLRFATVLGFALAAGCSGPTTPPPPVDPGPATAPVIRAITVPTSRVEAGQDITITAIVEDAETPLTDLTFRWATSAGTITGSGTTATWTMPKGITAGVDVTVTLTVTDTYNTIVNNQLVQRQFTVPGTSAPFRVHDSVAESKELARKFLYDLFGDSSVSVDACLVDFTDVCANREQGKNDERKDIVDHRNGYVVESRQVLGQIHASNGQDEASVHTAMLYIDRPINSTLLGRTCGDFEVTTIYVAGRWWICQSFYRRENVVPECAGMANDGGVARVMGQNGSSVKIPVIRK